MWVAFHIAGVNSLGAYSPTHIHARRGAADLHAVRGALEIRATYFPGNDLSQFIKSHVSKNAWLLFVCVVLLATIRQRSWHFGILGFWIFWKNTMQQFIYKLWLYLMIYNNIYIIIYHTKYLNQITNLKYIKYPKTQNPKIPRHNLRLLTNLSWTRMWVFNRKILLIVVFFRISLYLCTQQ